MTTHKRKMTNIYTSLISMIFVIFIIFTFNTQARGLAREPALDPEPPNPQPTRQRPTQFLPSIQNPTAYCPSYGGYTDYEYISSVSYTPNADGTIKLVVQVYISNPEGCVSGEPCPSYDGSPEYVNVWVDWNGDQIWSENEKVMDKALTGYTAINYQGTMTAITQFSPPATVADTSWLRANLGWDFDPNDPCELYWTWGNVVDKELTLKQPKINQITAKGKGTTNNQPETGSPVELEADIDVPTGYEITKCSWTGKMTPGEGDINNKCHYEYTPATGAGPSDNTYGEKNVTLTLSYKHTASGVSGKVSKNDQYKVFFNKSGDDDGDCIWWHFWASCEPNWFEYWGDDGAVTQLTRSDVEYDPSKGANSYGAYDFSSDMIELGGAAAQLHYPGGIVVPTVANKCPGGNFGGAQGIDCATEVVEHEARHKWIHHNWDSGGIWNGLTDSDQNVPSAGYDDDLPDSYELSTTHTLTTTVDSCNLQLYKKDSYKYYGDNEFTVMTYSNGKTGVAVNDWANPGKQTNPTYAPVTIPDFIDAEPGVISSPIYSNMSYTPETIILSGMGNLTGVYSDIGVDTNSNSLFDSLRLSVGVQINDPELYHVVAWLESGTGSPIAFAGSQSTLTPGSYTIHLNFDGKIIQNSGINGPYNIARVELRVSDRELLVASGDDVLTTSAYSHTNFDPASVKLTTPISDTGVDSNADTLFDLLRIDVTINVQQAGTYSVFGELIGSSFITSASTEVPLSAGLRTVSLEFDGASIFQHRQNGPYDLKALRIKDTNGNILDLISEAFTTSAYSYLQFQHGDTTINSGSFSDQGLDIGSDGDYDYLRFQFQINAGLSGLYFLQAELDDSSGSLITEINQEFSLVAGLNNLTLDFPGGPIFSHAVDGPYQLTSLALLKADGTLLDILQPAHSTQAYSYTSFSMPLVALTNSYYDYGVDVNFDNYYDYLSIDIGFISGEDGVVFALGRLVDQTGTELGWAEAFMEVLAGVPHTITLSFNGDPIFANGKDGPYELRNLLLYNTADPDQSSSVLLAHTTDFYSYADFDDSEWLFLPLIAKD